VNGIGIIRIFGTDRYWRIRHDGKAENVYQTKKRRLRLLSRLRPSEKNQKIPGTISRKMRHKAR
jgi:hypothetical protein